MLSSNNNEINQIYSRLNSLIQEVNSHTVALGTQFKDINDLKKEMDIQIKFYNELSKKTYSSPSQIYNSEIEVLKQDNQKIKQRLSDLKILDCNSYEIY